MREEEYHSAEKDVAVLLFLKFKKFLWIEKRKFFPILPENQLESEHFSYFLIHIIDLDLESLLWI